MSSTTTFHDRLELAAGEISYRQLGELTDTHPETVRRYMQGQAPSAAFITNLCHAKGISGEWLLSGTGPMRIRDLTAHALKAADPNELMGAVANVLTQLIERVDRLERLVQLMETRLHAFEAQRSSAATVSVSSDEQGRAQPGSESRGQAVAQPAGAGASRRVARALTQRSSQTDAERS